MGALCGNKHKDFMRDKQITSTSNIFSIFSVHIRMQENYEATSE